MDFSICAHKVGFRKFSHNCLRARVQAPRGPTPTKILYEIPNPMVILARFQIPRPRFRIPSQDSIAMAVAITALI